MINNWNEIRTAYKVAQLGTVTAAAQAIGVHRATVIRHIDALESVLGQKIFLRHSQGYTPTEAGRDLMQVAEGIEHQFAALLSRNDGRNATLSGELIITAMEILTPNLMPAMQKFQTLHPDITLKYEMSKRVYALEYGEAHIALRAGPKPKHPDNVVQPYIDYKLGMYAHRSYIEQYGCPSTEQEFNQHRFVFVSREETKAPFEVWYKKVVPPENIVFKASSEVELHLAVESGLGIGLYPLDQVHNNSDLIEVYPRKEQWQVPIWLVTHIDQHHTHKVQAFLKLLKAERDTHKKQVNNQVS